MPFPTDGVYTIKNAGRDLMLDLTGSSTAKGNKIQGYASNGTVAQQVYIRICTPFVIGPHTRILVGDQETIPARVRQQSCQHSVMLYCFAAVRTFNVQQSTEITVLSHELEFITYWPPLLRDRTGVLDNTCALHC
ncbi:hypothetical protein BDR03DRAFT_191439 [Suillus americanus]|nr:hypothetical protein BDR03DRAFT_191439 [Suillus americanus]